MIKLSIVTINYNDAIGLKKTMESVLSQSYMSFEYIVIDGGSTDGSKVLIEQFAKQDPRISYWVSEPDAGIYNAMNKGIKKAKGEYVQFLNSGDCLVGTKVVAEMINQLSLQTAEPPIMYGNMLKQLPKQLYRDKGFEGRQPSMHDFYLATINHSSAYIKRILFDTYGLYDEKLRIVSDWKWYLQVVIFAGVNPVYIDLDVSIFDMHGISSTDSETESNERKQVLEELLPEKILSDYRNYSHPIIQWKRIRKYKGLYFLVNFLERLMFKFEQKIINR